MDRFESAKGAMQDSQNQRTFCGQSSSLDDGVGGQRVIIGDDRPVGGDLDWDKTKESADL